MQASIRAAAGRRPRAGGGRPARGLEDRVFRFAPDPYTHARTHLVMQ
eukprot:COSAG02_NODE_21990_length_767_cov_1.357784_2_plen_46_part_01